MPFTIKIASLACALLTISNTLAAVLSSQARWCPTGVGMIGVRGTNQSFPFGGMIDDLANKVIHAIPGSQAIGVAYPASMLPTYKISQRLGVQNTTAYIKYCAEHCPRTSLVVAGYSQGGQVVLDAICGTTTPRYPSTPPLPASYRSNIKSIVVWGDPSHVRAASDNTGTSKRNGEFSRPGYACPNFADRMKSWCDTGDPHCDSGNNEEVHWQYKKYNKEALAWIKKCLGMK